MTFEGDDILTDVSALVVLEQALLGMCLSHIGQLIIPNLDENESYTMPKRLIRSHHQFSHVGSRGLRAGIPAILVPCCHFATELVVGRQDRLDVRRRDNGR